MSEYPKVFISYSHETLKFERKVLRFSNKLRMDYDIDAMIDQYVESPEEGWSRWMERQIENSDFVLIVCTKPYFEKIEDYCPTHGKGAVWEMGIIRQVLYDSYGFNSKFIPVFFDDYCLKYIPKPLKATTYYNIGKVKDQKKLVARLNGNMLTKKPPIGNKKFCELKTRTLFVPPVINHTMWDEASWIATAYINSQDKERTTRVLLIFKETKVAQTIFRDLNKMGVDGYIDILQITFIKGQYKYWLKIGVSKRYLDDYLITNEMKDSLVFSRYIFNLYNIDPYEDSGFIKTEQAFQKLGYIEITHGDGNSSPTSNILVLKIRNVVYRLAEDIDENDSDFSIINNTPNDKCQIPFEESVI